MKSAKNQKPLFFFLSLLLGVLIFSLLLSGCQMPSFLSIFRKDEAKQNENNATPADTEPEDEPEPPVPVFYNRYTGLVCSETVSAYRPLSVCIGNFDEKKQEGLSFADILIESPVDNNTTRLWALTTDWDSAAHFGNVASTRDYMMPLVSSFGGVTAYAGTTDTPGIPAVNLAGDTLDYVYQNMTTTYTKNADGTLSATAAALKAAANANRYSLTDGNGALPYTLAPTDAPVTGNGNRISSVRYRFSESNTAGFDYDGATGTYRKIQNGAAHTDPLTGESLAFENVLLLLCNVRYYYASDAMSYTLDTASGGSGFCYTGGGTISVSWSCDENGTVVFRRADTGEKLTLNRGKTYIAMLKINDSATIVAK